jgi:predicted lipid carrier protein YhbT
MNMPVRRPQLPRPLALPLRLMPERAHGLVVSRALTRVFAREVAEGELDFLEGRCVRIRVRDAGAGFAVRLEGGRFREVASAQPADLTIEGEVYDFLLLVSGREDPDTLFFQRHLSMEGSTALGVHLKNFLASVDPASLPLPSVFLGALDRGLTAYERFA